jgi:hypothetical protein
MCFFSGVLASAKTTRGTRDKHMDIVGVRSSPTTYALRSKTAAFFTLFFGVTLNGEEMDQYFAAPSGLSGDNACSAFMALHIAASLCIFSLPCFCWIFQPHVSTAKMPHARSEAPCSPSPSFYSVVISHVKPYFPVISTSTARMIDILSPKHLSPKHKLHLLRVLPSLHFLWLF